MVTKNQVEEKLSQVIDPELGINIVDLGLIYKVEVKEREAFILMTLTFPGCPLGSIINQEVHEKVGQLPLKKINLKITFDPPWDLTKISASARAELGIN